MDARLQRNADGRVEIAGRIDQARGDQVTWWRKAPQSRCRRVTRLVPCQAGASHRCHRARAGRPRTRGGRSIGVVPLRARRRAAHRMLLSVASQAPRNAWSEHPGSRGVLLQDHDHRNARANGSWCPTDRDPGDACDRRDHDAGDASDRRADPDRQDRAPPRAARSTGSAVRPTLFAAPVIAGSRLRR